MATTPAKSRGSKPSYARRSTVGSDPSTDAGPSSMSKAQQMRHAISFRYASTLNKSASQLHELDSDFLRSFEDASNLSVEIGHLRSIGGGCSPSKTVCAKLELALQLKDECEKDFSRFCESRNQRKQAQRAAALAALSLTESEPATREKRDLERLMRKLAPSMGNVAATHPELVHMLQSCAACSSRVVFCSSCARKASEFFNSFSAAELDALYGSDLPAADADTLDAFHDAVAYREFRVLHPRPPSRHR